MVSTKEGRFRMGVRIRNYIRQHHVGLLALFLALTGGTAYALDGSNTVFSDDIVNAEVQTADIDQGAVTIGKLAPDSVNSGKVLNESLTGADINNDLLGQVPSAALGGTGRWRGGNTCDPGSTAFHTCAFVSIDLPSASRVLITGVANARSKSGSDVHGSCRLATHLGDLPASTVPVLVDNGSLVNGAGELVPVTAITGPLGPGGVDFAIRCNQQKNDIWYSHVQVTAVALSND